MSQEQQLEALSMLYKLTSNELSKIEAAEYIGVSRATFDNYINKGLIPKGRKR
jgi:predicted DNA-binding transcriptional regulator AlpA